MCFYNFGESELLACKPKTGSGNRDRMAALDSRLAGMTKRRFFDPEDEVQIMRKKLDEERLKRRELEAEIFRLRQERSDMCIRMNRLESSKLATNIPQCLVPLLQDAISQGLNPLQMAEEAERAKRTAEAAAKLAARPLVVGRPAGAIAPVRAASAVKPRPTTPGTATAATGQNVQQFFIIQNTPGKITTAAKPGTPASGGKNILLQQQTPQGTLNIVVPIADGAAAATVASDTDKDAGATGSTESTTEASKEPTAEQISPESPPDADAARNAPEVVTLE